MSIHTLAIETTTTSMVYILHVKLPTHFHTGAVGPQEALVTHTHTHFLEWQTMDYINYITIVQSEFTCLII